LALNGGIRWVSLNEREKAVNERGGKEDMRGKNTREKGDFWEGALFFILGDCIGAFFGGRLEDCITGFWLEKLVVGLLQGGTCCWEFWARGPGILTESWS
jgi:hypothetical protein